MRLGLYAGGHLITAAAVMRPQRCLELRATQCEIKLRLLPFGRTNPARLLQPRVGVPEKTHAAASPRVSPRSTCQGISDSRAPKGHWQGFSSHGT